MNIVEFKKSEKTCEQVLDEAKEAGLADVVVIGFTNDDCRYISSNDLDVAQVLFYLEHAKLQVLGVHDD